VIGTTGRALLVDATPDFTEQVARLAESLGRRPPGFDEVLLTHAHLGHYLGLGFLGREAMGAREVPLRVTDPMAAFLRGNRPWSHLLERRQARVVPLVPGAPFPFDGLEVVVFSVPHRAEDTDTVGVEVRGPGARVVYVPDADRWTAEATERIRVADAALVDGTFFSPAELPGAVLSQVPHPFVSESVGRLAGGKGEVLFTHLNHTNPLAGSAPPPLPSGFGVARDGDAFDLTAVRAPGRRSP
jgi:pyrroloquinoline quinone biosynthesis protein B